MPLLMPLLMTLLLPLLLLHLLHLQAKQEEEEENQIHESLTDDPFIMIVLVIQAVLMAIMLPFPSSRTETPDHLKMYQSFLNVLVVTRLIKSTVDLESVVPMKHKIKNPVPSFSLGPKTLMPVLSFVKNAPWWFQIILLKLKGF